MVGLELLVALTTACAPGVDVLTMSSIVSVESGGNPYAIGVVGGHLARQPKSLPEAVATLRSLDELGRNYSVGLAQLNKQHFARFALDHASAFDACKNLAAGAAVLSECFVRARSGVSTDQLAVRHALSCYYSGNFKRGYLADTQGGSSYVDRVLSHSRLVARRMDPAQRLVKGGPIADLD